MDNGLMTITNSIAVCDKKDVAKQIMTVCSSITPQFYRNLSVDDRKAERQSIELLTSGIEQEVLKLMCQLAIKQYPLERARDYKSYFDINYILTFYEKAFNFQWCERVKINKNYRYCSYEFNKYTNILTEYWKNEKNEDVIIKFIVPQNTIKENNKESLQRFYSPQYLNFLVDSIDDIEI